MQDVKDHRRLMNLSSKKMQGLILILLVAIVLAFTLTLDHFGMNLFSDRTTTISKAMLEEQYGLRVNLVAVTAAGGFVDVRMMILDPEKARSLLGNPDNFPALSIEDVTLQVSAQAKGQEINYEANSSVFLMFSNAGNVVRKGTPVTIRFGGLVLQPIDAQ